VTEVGASTRDGEHSGVKVGTRHPKYTQAGGRRTLKAKPTDLRQLFKRPFRVDVAVSGLGGREMYGVDTGSLSLLRWTLSVASAWLREG